MTNSPPRWLWSLGAGALGAFGYAPANLWPLTLVGVAALAALVFHAPTVRSAAWTAWLWSVAHFTVSLNWIAHSFTYQDAMPHWFGYGAVVGLSLYLALYPAAGAAVARWGARDRPIAFAFAFAATWVLSEWLRGTAFTGFPWSPLGVVALPMGELSQVATLVGTYGLSGVIALTGALLWLVTIGWRAVPLTGVALLVIASAVALPVPTLPVPAGEPTLVVVQPNFSQDEKHDAAYSARAWARQVALTRAARTPPGPRLILWPEGAIEEPPLEDGIVADRVAALLRPADTLLAGGITLDRGPFGVVRSATNSVFAFDANGDVVGRYDKAHLVPYGEYLPVPGLLGALGLARLVPGDVYYAPGPGPATLSTPAGPIAVQVCYEIVFSGEVLPSPGRPRALFNPSNDAWFGAWGSPQFVAQSRLRAREEAMPTIRSTTNGVSVVIDAGGRVLSTVARHVAGTIVAPIPPVGQPTVFSRAGNTLPLALAALTLLAAIALARRRA